MKIATVTHVGKGRPMQPGALTQAGDASIAIMQILAATDPSVWRAVIANIVVSCCMADDEPFEAMWDTMEFCEAAMNVMVCDVAGHA